MAEKKSGIDQALIRDLANILNDTDLTEIEVEQDDMRIRVSRAGTMQYVQAPIAAPAYAAAPVHAAPAPHHRTIGASANGATRDSVAAPASKQRITLWALGGVVLPPLGHCAQRVARNLRT